MLAEFLTTERIAYFTMEIALRSDIPTYSGGLGVLAGDTIRSAADLEVPFVTVTLISRQGYFRQAIDADGRQLEQPDPWDPSGCATLLGAKIAVPLESRQVWVSAWCYVLEGHMGGRQPVILLDTDLAENAPTDRDITGWLYGGDNTYRLKQEIVLGIGGVRMLRALGFKIHQYHMNEGHSALLALDLLRNTTYPASNLRAWELRFDIPRVRKRCNFTTHTPVEAGHDQFSYDLVARVLGEFIDYPTLKQLAGVEVLNMTRLALNLSEYVNGVTRRHAETSRHMFPGYQVQAITNGVHPFTWTSPAFRRVYDQYLPGWCHEPGMLVRADCCLPDDAIWNAHIEAKHALLDLVRERCGQVLHPALPILGFARRMTAYKRPDLMFSDLVRLRSIAARYPFQIVLAGKAHPRDEPGKQLIELLHRHIHELAGDIPVVYLPNYDLALAQALVAGVDVWVNTPLRPQEASGTSGMKAAFSGVPSLSVLDGWWVEGCIEGVTGWAVGDSTDAPGDRDAESLYGKIETAVLPCYYGERDHWLRIMKGTIAKTAPFFNSHRMLRRYATEAYLR